MTNAEIKSMLTGYTHHHDAYSRGYISRKIDGTAENRNCKFGECVIVHRPSFNSTTYHIIEYWVKEK